MSTVHMLAGIPGSGKSHYAKECCKRHRAVLVGGCIVLMEMIVGMQRQAGQGQQGKTGQGKAWHPDTPWLTVKMLSYNKWSANQGRVLKSHAKVLERRDS